MQKDEGPPPTTTLQDSLRRMRVGKDLVNSQVYEAANDLDAKDNEISRLRLELKTARTALAEISGGDWCVPVFDSPSAYESGQIISEMQSVAASALSPPGELEGKGLVQATLQPAGHDGSVIDPDAQVDDGPKAFCFDCARPYADGGFPDFIIPYCAWERISPTGDDGGLLCPSCICKRLHDVGMTEVPGSFMSGPIRSVDYITMQNLRGLENIELAIDGRNNAYSAVRDLIARPLPEPPRQGDRTDDNSDLDGGLKQSPLDQSQGEVTGCKDQ